MKPVRGSRRRGVSGLSLVEIMVAAAGTLLLLGLLYGAVSGGTRNAKKIEGELESQSQALMGIERMMATLRLAHSASVDLLPSPVALSFLSADRRAAPALAAPPSSAYVMKGFQTSPLAWKRFLVYHHHPASRELRCTEIPYPVGSQYAVAALEPAWLSGALLEGRYPHTVVARSVQTVSFGRQRPPGVDIDLTVLRNEVGQEQEARLKFYVAPRNG